MKKKSSKSIVDYVIATGPVPAADPILFPAALAPKRYVLRRWNIAGSIYLVPADLCADGHFAGACEILRNTPHGGTVLWNGDEQSAFQNARCDPRTITLL